MHIQIYIGEECDLTKSGASVTAFAKSWRSLPIQSWSGGVKMADRASGQPRHQVKGILSELLADEVGSLFNFDGHSVLFPSLRELSSCWGGVEILHSPSVMTFGHWSVHKYTSKLAEITKLHESLPVAIFRFPCTDA